MNEDRIFIELDDEELEDYLFNSLTELGFAPGPDIISIVVSLFIQYLVEKGEELD